MSAEHPLSLALPATLVAELEAGLFTPDGAENFAVLLCAPAAMERATRLLARELLLAPPAAYRERLSYHLEIAPDFFNTIVDKALATGLHPVLVHSHPGAHEARYSPSDDHGERRLLPVLAQLLPGRFVASLLVTPHEMQGRTVHDGRFALMQRVEVIGSRVEVFEPTAHDEEQASAIEETYDRQVRAIGSAGMQLVHHLRVGVVGAGGTGSAVLEQLARLGVRDITVVDPDALEVSNLSRVWGSYPEDARRHRPKVEVLRDHLRAVSPSIAVRSIQGNATRQSVLNELRDRHLVFGCTDNHWSRAVLNRFAHQYLIPLVDMGVRLDAREGMVSAAAGQVTLAGPGLSCLRCAQLIDPERVRLEAMPVTERASLAREGYIAGADEPAPAVISLNTTVASMAVTAALSLFVNLTGGAPPAGLRYDARTGQTFVVAARHDELCDVCSADAGVISLGDLQPVTAYE